MSRIKNSYDIKRINSNLIELIPEIREIDINSIKFNRPANFSGIIKLKCNCDIDGFRKKDILINCFGANDNFELDKLNIAPIQLRRDQSGNITILNDQLVVEIDNELINRSIGIDASWLYDLVVTERIKNAFSDTTGENGFVYLLESDFGYKIGCSKNPKTRNNIFNVKLPFDVKMIRAVNVVDYRNTEKILHSYFEDKHIRGEWFEMTNVDISNFDEILLQYQIK